MIINDRFPVLSTVAWVLKAVGILIGVIGLLALGAELIECIKLMKPGAEWIWSSDDYIRIIGGIVFTILGLVVMALAEIIGVLFAIEMNTRHYCPLATEKGSTHNMVRGS